MQKQNIPGTVVCILTVFHASRIIEGMLREKSLYLEPVYSGHRHKLSCVQQAFIGSDFVSKRQYGMGSAKKLLLTKGAVKHASYIDCY